MTESARRALFNIGNCIFYPTIGCVSFRLISALSRKLHKLTLVAISLISFQFACRDALAEDLLSAPIFPGARYTKGNGSSEALAHWNSEISMQAVEISDNSVRMSAIWAFMTFAHAADVSMNISGFPDAMFPKSNVIEPSTNLLVFEFDRESQDQLQSGGGQSTNAALDLSKASPQIIEMLQTGLKKQSDGCLAQWHITADNVIDGYILAIGNWLGNEEKKQCLENIAPSAFGVMPAVSTYDLRKFDPNLGPGAPILFDDNSETILELQAAAACRTTLKNFGVQCPKSLLLAIFSHHRDIVNAIK